MLRVFSTVHSSSTTTSSYAWRNSGKSNSRNKERFLLQFFDEFCMTADDNIIIAHRLKLETNTVTPLLQRMEKMGIITRLRGKEDKRQQIVFLTDKGIEMEQQAYENIPAAMGERLAACKLKKKDYGRLAQHLDLLIEALGEK